MHKTKIHSAELISTEGPYLEARLKIGNQIFHVMDEFSLIGPIQNGEILNIELNVTLLSENETWEDIFSGNPEKIIGLVNLEGWKYKALGKIISVNPVIVDCGLLNIDDAIHSHDQKIIGDFVAFTLSRLSAYAI